ncbi:hypothetical protein LAZ67_1001644 [Cordylochernes scorpioides]|uniref:DUF7041 domain-containing protein n=1 Tax=Cordylochernes scorpioides TaxID=51811 RepID=A0ABY6JY98_9ARAC|nr:hypothetical protein LAZ67_1001644 [Cordylochernes scorpioides]
MDQRTCIKFCVKNEIKCTDAFRMLTVEYGEATFDQSNVYRWYQKQHRMNIANVMLDSVRDDPNLLLRVITEVREFIISPPPDNKYDALKKAIIKCTADSEFKKLQQLLTQEELGDRLPSQLLRHLRQLIGESKAVSDTTLKMLWMQRLPKNIQIILTTQEQASLNSLADLADRVTEITSSPSSSTSTLEKELASLRAEISALKIDLNKKEERIPRSRSRSSSSSRKSSPNSYRKYNPNGSWCWYHFRFKHHARKCISPCTFNKKAKNQQENSNNNQ